MGDNLMADLEKLPIPAQVKAQLLNLGISSDDINNGTAIVVSLYQQALKGNVSAIDKIQKMFKNVDVNDEEKAKDITVDVKKEEKRILNILEGLTEEQKKANKELIHQIAFMSVTLKNLAENISKFGVKEKYCNGANQWGYKDRTEVKTYNNMFKNYQSAMKQLNDLLVANGGNYNDNFDNFGEDE